jgi:hypothetical protein
MKSRTIVTNDMIVVAHPIATLMSQVGIQNPVKPPQLAASFVIDQPRSVAYWHEADSTNVGINVRCGDITNIDIP